MDTSATLEDLRRRAQVAAGLSRDLSTLEAVLVQLDAPVAAGLIRDLDLAALLTLPPDEAARLLRRIKVAIEHFHKVRLCLAASTEEGSDQRR